LSDEIALWLITCRSINPIIITAIITRTSNNVPCNHHCFYFNYGVWKKSTDHNKQKIQNLKHSFRKKWKTLPWTMLTVQWNTTH
jgi:hypothetical protein